MPRVTAQCREFLAYAEEGQIGLGPDSVFQPVLKRMPLTRQEVVPDEVAGAFCAGQLTGHRAITGQKAHQHTADG